MNFPYHHLSPLIKFNNSFLTLSDILNVSKQTFEQCPNEKSKPIYFQFNEADKLFNDFYEAGICDLSGKATQKFQALCLQTSFNDLNVFESMIHQIKEILTSKHMVLNTILKIDNHGSIPISIKTSLEELFNHVIHLSNENKLKEIDKQTVFKILQIYLIGSSVPSIMGKQVFETLAVRCFGSLFSDDVIKRWFTCMTHLQDFFSYSGNDLDVRIIISSNQIETVGYFSDLFLNFLNQQIPSKVLPHLLKHYPRSKNRNDILNTYLLSSTAIKNRVRVKDSHSTFSLIALNTDTIPIDLNCVGSTFNESKHKHEPSLENSSLTSLNSLSIPLLQFLSSEYQLEEFSSYLCNSGIQTLLDILFNCATPTTHNQFGWRYFLRKYHRMLDPNDEKKMVESVLEYRKNNDYTIISKHKYLPDPSDIKTLGGFIYLLLANDFTKVETEKPTDPFILSEYLFRACQSLSTYSEMNDQHCLKLWECVDQFYWKPLKRSSKLDSIYSAIKTAILEDKIPFSILSAYINVLAYLLHPKRATMHCHTSIIRLKFPISVFAPIRLQTDSETLFDYFSTNTYTMSLQKIHEFFVRSSELILVDFPLLPFFTKFEIHLPTLEFIFQKWIKIDQPTLKLIGLQLYLSCFPFLCDSTILFDEIFLNPHFFISIETSQQKLAILQSLNWIAEKKFRKATPLIQQLSNCQLDQYDSKTWLEILLETNTPYALDLAYSFFKKYHNEIQEPQILWSLYSHLLRQNPLHKAFFVYQLLQHSCQLSPKRDLVQFFIPLLKQYQCLNTPLKFQYHSSIFKAFHHFFDQGSSIEFKDLEQRLEFAGLLFAFLQEHFLIKTYENECDNYLLDASHLNFLTKHHRQILWTQRIIQLIDEPHVKYGAVLFLFALENKWISPEKLIQKNHSMICLKLLEALLKETQCQFIKNLLALLKIKLKKEQISFSFYELLLNHLNQKPLKLNSENEKEILLLLIKMASKNEKNKVILLLLEFLDSSTQLLAKENENFLWHIFEQILKNKCPDRTKLFDVLSKLLTYSKNPTESLLNWIKAYADMIAIEIEKRQNIDSLKAFIRLIQQHRYPLIDFEKKVWEICVYDYRHGLEDENILSIFQSMDASTCIKFISHGHHSILLHYLIKALDYSPDKPLLLLHWVNCSLSLYEQKNESFELESWNKFFIQYSEKLIAKGYFLQTIQTLLKVVDQSPSVNALFWDSIGKYILKASVTDLLTLFFENDINCLKELNASPLITKQMIEKFWLSSDLTIKEWKFLITMIEAINPKNLSLYAKWWKKLNSLQNQTDFFIIVEKSISFTFDPKHEAIEDQILFLEFTYDRLSCLKKASHPHLIEYFLQIDLFHLCKNKRSYELLQTICSFLMDHAITSLKCNEFNIEFFQQLQSRKSFFAENLFKNRAQEKEKWEQHYDFALIEALDHPSIQAQKESCLILQHLIQLHDSTNSLEKNFLGLITKKIQTYSFLNHQDNQNDPNYPELKQIIIKFCKWLTKNQKISATLLIKILNIFIKKPSIESSLLSKIFYDNFLENPSSKKLVQYKQIFFSTVAAVLTLKDIRLIECYIELIQLLEKNVPLNQEEKSIKAKCFYVTFLNYYNQKSILINQKTNIDQSDILEITKIFINYAPHLMHHKEFFQNGFEKTVAFSINYTTNLKNKLINQSNFNEYVGMLLSIKDQLSACKFFSTISYEKNLFNTLFKLNSNHPKLLVNFLFEHGKALINNAMTGKNHGIIDFLYNTAFLFPPIITRQEINDNEINNIGILLMNVNQSYLIKHWMNFRNLILVAEKFNIFKEAPKKLLLIKVWANMCDDPGPPMIDLKDREFLINCFCSFKSSFHCTIRAVEMLNKYIKDIKPNEYENPNFIVSFCDLQKIYPVILNAIMQLETFEENDGKINVLFELTQNTFKTFNEKINSQFVEIIFPYLDELMATIPDHIRGSSITHFLIMYLNFLILEIRNPLKKISIEYYTYKIKQVMTLIRKNLIHHPISNAIVNKLIESLTLALTGLQDSLHSPFNKNRRDLLFNWIQSICEEHPDDCTERKCTILIHFFIRILFRSNDFYFWFDTSSSKKNQNIKQTMIDFVEKQGTDEEKIVLKTLFLHFQIHPKDRIKHIHRIVDMIDLNENLSANAAIRILIVVLNSFFMWKKDDFKMRLWQLFEQNPLEEQNVFEIFLDKIKHTIEAATYKNKINFLSGFVKQSFEIQWLTPSRPKCLEFMLWAKKDLDLSFNDSQYQLYNLMIEFRLIHSNPEKIYEFWLKTSKKFDDFARYIFCGKNISHSWILVHNICSSRIDIKFKEALFKKWISLLNEYEKNDHQPIFVQHFSDIGNYFFEKTSILIFKNHLSSLSTKSLFPQSNFNPEKLINEFPLYS